MKQPDEVAPEKGASERAHPFDSVERAVRVGLVAAIDAGEIEEVSTRQSEIIAAEVRKIIPGYDELLAACKNVLESLGGDDAARYGFDGHAKILRAAIALSEGKEPPC